MFTLFFLPGYKNMFILTTKTQAIKKRVLARLGWMVQIGWWDDVSSLMMGIFLYFSQLSLAIRVSTRASKVEEMAPIPITACLDIIAVGLLSEGAKAFGGFKVVWAVNYLDVPKITCLAKSFLWEMPTPHLSRGVLPVWLWVYYLPAPLYHGRAVCQVWEQERRPVAKNVVVPKLHPPVSFFWILKGKPEDQDVIKQRDFSKWNLIDCQLFSLYRWGPGAVESNDF